MSIAFPERAFVGRAFIDSLHSEWLKQRRSLASWLVIVGAFFTPAIMVAARLVQHAKLPALYAADDFWVHLWRNCWESTAILFLPVGTILATSLIGQIEFRNNAWKQVHALPLRPSTIYFSKLAIVLLMLLQFILLFNVGVWLAAVVPALILPGIDMPTQPIPFRAFLRDDLLYFVACLPIVALQYALSVRFRNFIVPLGIGFVVWAGTLAAVLWKWSFLFPYAYVMLHYVNADPGSRVQPPPIPLYWPALAYFLAITVAGYIAFATRKEKG